MAKPQLHDPRLLRAIAHPVRNRILTQLSASGPMRAADVAAELDIPANQASFHLRQLAKYGLVEEDPEAARDRRDRVWRTTAEHGYTVDMSEVTKAPGGKAAGAVFRRAQAAWHHRVVDEAYSEERWGSDTHISISEEAVRLTKDEARELNAELGELVDRWVERTRGRDDERLTYVLLTLLLPYPDRGDSD